MISLLSDFKASVYGKDFLWGVAISAAQNEGAAFTGGRGPSIWDQFANRTGKINGSARPSMACDFYHRYKDDLLLAKALGFKVFRFSISWSRILPEGTGRVNKEGIQFYHKLINEILLLDMIPFVTLYHWDLPQALEKEGGWASHLLVKWFSRVVTVCAEEFGGTVKNWIVLNEPMGFTSLGYLIGKHAPGKTNVSLFLSSVHNACLAQAEGGRILRLLVKNAYIGTSFSCSEVKPFSQKETDLQAANRVDILLNRLFVEPSLGMNYPHDDFPLMDKLHLQVKAWKFTERMHFDFDFIGVQNYFPVTVKYNGIIPYVQATEVKASTRKVATTAMGWEINADSFYNILAKFNAYKGIRSIIVSENGAYFKDELKNGVVNDIQRIHYFQQYLKAMLKAKRNGMKIDGYFAWTLTDNFEWAEGFKARFGLVHIDFETQLRTIKNSGYWWRDFLKD